MQRGLFLIVSICLFGSCAVSQTSIKEDLSIHRPRYKYEADIPSQKDSLKVLKEKEVIRVTPTHHVNDLIDTMLVKMKSYYGPIVHAKGYRVQIYSGTNMGSASSYESRTRSFVAELGEHDVYRNYHSPTWKVRVGDFLDRLSAQQLYHQLKKQFPNALVVPDSDVLLKKIK